MIRVLQHLRLRTILALALALMAIIAFGLLTIILGEQAAERVEADIGASLGELAQSFRSDLEHAITARQDDILVLSRGLSRNGSGELAPDDWRAPLEQLRAGVPGFGWIAVANPEGRILVSAPRGLEGQSAAGSVWFAAGLQASAVTRVSPGLPLPEGTALLDITAPVRNRTGEQIAVAGARLDREFAELLRRDLLDRSKGRHQDLEVVVRDRAGVAIIGSNASVGRNFSTWFAANADVPGDGYGLYRWEDGSTRVIGSATASQGVFAELGWTVLVMSREDVAFAPVKALQWRIAGIGAVATLVFIAAGFFLASITTRPLRRIMKEADAIGIEDGATIGEIRVPPSASQETVSLARSLQAMLRRLEGKEAQLRETNRTLDRTVAIRTAEAIQARDEAIEATRSKSRFLAAASHDLRQPLQALSLLINALERRVSGSEERQIVLHAAGSIAALRGMFDSLLDVSKLEAGVVKPDFTTVVLKPRLEALVAEFMPLATQAGLGLRLAGRSDRAILTDAVLLEAVLRNTLSNAIKFTARGGLLVTARVRRNGLLVQVHDTGPGIAHEKQGRIFEAFERSGKTARGDNDGLGLGLSIVTRLVAALGATLTFRSRLGRGTSIGILVPFAERSATQGIPPVEPQTTRIRSDRPEVTLIGRKVLVLDDDGAVRDALLRELSAAGANVTACDSIATAIKAAREQFFELAIVDYHLRDGATGVDFVMELEALAIVKPAILFVTGATDAEARARMAARGASVLTKPLSFATLEQALLDQIRP